MAHSTPTTQQVADAIVATIETEISRSIPLLPKSFTRVLCKALAGFFILVYRYAGWSLLQQFAQHASFRETTVNGRKLTPLIELGRLVGAGNPVAATSARLDVSFDVLSGGSTLPAGRQLIYPDSGVVYITESAVTLLGGTESVSVLASSDPDGNGGTGVQGNRATGDVLKWANAVPQVSEVGATVTATLTTAADAETEDAYRKRVVEAFGARAQGGAYADYRIWGSEDPGILNIYPYTGRAPGTVDVYVEATVASSNEDGIPSQDQLDAVEALIEYDSSGIATRRPVTARVNPHKITRQGFDVVVDSLVATDTVAAQDSIREALDDFLRAREPYISGLSALPRQDRVTAASVAGVVDEAAATVGATVGTVELSLGGTPIIAYTLGQGQKAKLNNVNYQ